MWKPQGFFRNSEFHSSEPIVRRLCTSGVFENILILILKTFRVTDIFSLFSQRVASLNQAGNDERHGSLSSITGGDSVCQHCMAIDSDLIKARKKRPGRQISCLYNVANKCPIFESSMSNFFFRGPISLLFQANAPQCSSASSWLSVTLYFFHQNEAFW